MSRLLPMKRKFDSISTSPFDSLPLSETEMSNILFEISEKYEISSVSNKLVVHQKDLSDFDKRKIIAVFDIHPDAIFLKMPELKIY